MSNRPTISFTDVNHILFNLTFFQRLPEILSSYGLTLDDVINNPIKFRRFVHIYRHFRFCYNANPFSDEYPNVNDLHMLFKVFIKHSIYYAKEKENT